MGNLAVDINAQALMENYLSNDKGIPAVTSSLDHVLFRAVSMAVSARDSLASELRVRCCIEMVAYENFYRFQKNHEQLARFAPDYIDSCLDCAMMDEGSSVWTLSALASVVRRPIMSVYPSVNGPTDSAVHILNATFQPRVGEISNQKVRVLWSSEGVDITSGNWKPNHFVPIFDEQKQESPPVKTQPRSVSSDFDSSQDMDDFNDTFDEDEASGSAKEELQMEKVEMEVAEGGFPSESNKFMDIFEAFEMITTATVVHSDIPRGLKENVWFLIDNSHNTNHPERRNTFYDDCGVWDSRQGSVAKSHLLLDDGGILCTLKIHKGEFKKLSIADGKKEWVTIDPQPDPDKVVICHRYYAFLKRDTNYKRRVIWFTMPPSMERGKDVALVEYKGKFPGFIKQRHGNLKHGRGAKSNYVRTDPKLLEEIAQQIKMGANMKPMKMYKEIQKKLGSSCTLRDARQIRNLKYSILKRQRKEQEQEHHILEDKLGQDFTLTPAQDAEVSIADESGTLVTESPSNADSPIKVIIHQGHRDVATTMTSLEDVTEISHGRFVQLEEGGQTFSIINTDANGVPDPNTQTIIMVKDLKDLDALAAGEVVVTEAM